MQLSKLKNKIWLYVVVTIMMLGVVLFAINKNDYIDSIDDMGNWYADHIATYQSILERDKKQDLNNESIYIKKYNLVDKNTNKEEGGKEFNVISELIDENSSEWRDGNIEILRASEKAVKYYQKNFYKIKFKERLASYPCDLIKNSTGSYNMAGDDCVRFLFSTMNNVNKKFVYDLEKISK